MTCDDSHVYLNEAENANFGAVAVDVNDDLTCAGCSCNVATLTAVQTSYAFNTATGEAVVTYQATDQANNTASATRIISIVDNSPPRITVFNTGEYYYNSKSLNQLFCGDASADFFLELWSRGFKVEKACLYDNVVAGQGLQGGNYNDTTVNGAVSTDEIPPHCEVIYRFHEGPADQPNWVPVDADCGTAAYGGTVITFDQMALLFKQWCVTTSGGELCNNFSQTGVDGQYQTFSIEYICEAADGGHQASACRVVENVDGPIKTCHAPTPTPTKVPTTSPTSGYVLLIDLTIADTTQPC
jgi:hypothetical protein